MAAGLDVALLGEAALIKLVGVIDDDFDRDAIVRSLDGHGGPLLFDLDGVTRVTSFGVREWINMLRELPAQSYYFAKCRPAIVAQLNSVSQFAGRGVVVSLYSPYLCDGCGETFEVLVDLRTQVEVIRAQAAAKETCGRCGGEAVFDDLESTYFAHVASQPSLSLPPLVESILDGKAETPRLRIEKSVKDDVTVLTLRGPLDDRARIDRYTDGLEGYVVLNLANVTGATVAGVRKLFASLPPDLEAYVARVPPALLAVMVEAKDAFGSVRIASEGQQHELLAALPVDVPPSAIVRALAEREATPASSVDVGRARKLVAGKYETLSRLGEGGMAEVFLGRQIGPEGFSKRVVLKKILPSLAGDPDFVRMFIREARVAARLIHPNVVQIYDLVRDGDGWVIVMEFVPGLDLQAAIRAARKLKRWVPVTVALRVAADVCAGLHAAHTAVDDMGKPAAIIHRDVSPHNVLLSINGMVKLSDFGVARAADIAGQTRVGRLKGKLAYMAPEQLAHGIVDERCDVYAAGLLLYVTLAHHHPFAAADQMKAMESILKKPVPPPSSYRRGLPDGLDEIVARAVERDPQKRFQSADELRRALEGVMGAMPLSSSANDVGAWLSATQRDLEEARNASTVPADPDDVETEVLDGAGQSGAAPAKGP